MSAIYEALQRARKEGSKAPPPSAGRGGPRGPQGPMLDGHALGQFSGPMTNLYGNIRRFLDSQEHGVVLQFVSATPGEGTSMIAREFAYLAGTAGHRRTILLDGNGINLGAARLFNTPTDRGVVDLIKAGQPYDEILRSIPDSGMVVGSLIGDKSTVSLDAKDVRAAYAALRAQYDLVVIDSAAVITGRHSDLVPEAADGVILVVQAEKSRPAVVLQAKADIEQAGGNIIGSVLNKRRTYIPNFLYKIL